MVDTHEESIATAMAEFVDDKEKVASSLTELAEALFKAAEAQPTLRGKMRLINFANKINGYAMAAHLAIPPV